MKTAERRLPNPKSGSEKFTHVGNWNTPYGLIYGEFVDSENPGVEFFGQFIEMVGDIGEPRAIGDIEYYVDYKEMVLKITHRINETGTNMNDDYKFVEGNRVADNLKGIVTEGGLKPFWIEIQDAWMNIMYAKGQVKYMTQIIALSENESKERWGVS